MGKRWITIILIIITTFFLVFGRSGSGAAKEDRHWYMKILGKLDEVVKNQQTIISETRGLKEAMSVLNRALEKTVRPAQKTSNIIGTPSR